MIKIKIKIRGFRGLSPLFRAAEPEEYNKIRRKIKELGKKYNVVTEEGTFIGMFRHVIETGVIRYNPKWIYEAYKVRKIQALTLEDFIIQSFGHELAHKKTLRDNTFYIYRMYAENSCMVICDEYYAIKFNPLKTHLAEENIREIIKNKCNQESTKIVDTIKSHGKNYVELLATIPAYLSEMDIKEYFNLEPAIYTFFISLKQQYNQLSENPRDIILCAKKCKKIMEEVIVEYG